MQEKNKTTVLAVAIAAILTICALFGAIVYATSGNDHGSLDKNTSSMNDSHMVWSQYTYFEKSSNVRDTPDDSAAIIVTETTDVSVHRLPRIIDLSDLTSEDLGASEEIIVEETIVEETEVADDLMVVNSLDRLRAALQYGWDNGIGTSIADVLIKCEYLDMDGSPITSEAQAQELCEAIRIDAGLTEDEMMALFMEWVQPYMDKLAMAGGSFSWTVVNGAAAPIGETVLPEESVIEIVQEDESVISIWEPKNNDTLPVDIIMGTEDDDDDMDENDDNNMDENKDNVEVMMEAVSIDASILENTPSLEQRIPNEFLEGFLKVEESAETDSDL